MTILTKAERAVKAQKASAKRRVAVALANYLKKQNPGVKLAGATVEKLKGGALKIKPIKANAAKKRGVLRIRKYSGGYLVTLNGKRVGAASTYAEARVIAMERGGI